MVSYLVLCVKLGLLLPGHRTIPDQIVDNRKPYFEALEAADMAVESDAIDLSKMEELIEGMLAVQLTGIIEAATGKQYLVRDGKSE